MTAAEPGGSLDHALNETREWLEADGLGGFAMGTVTGVRTRRYHALLSVSPNLPAGRVTLLRGFDAWIETPEGTWAITTQRYADGHLAPDGVRHLASFSLSPWPRWEFRLPSGLRIVHELLMPHGSPSVFLSWKIVGDGRGCRLIVRPLPAFSPIHTLRREAIRIESDSTGTSPGCVVWTVPGSVSTALRLESNGAFAHEPVWYRDLQYDEETRRGFDSIEDLNSPGVFRFGLDTSEAVLQASASRPDEVRGSVIDTVCDRIRAVRRAERARRGRLGSRLHAAADKYIVKRGSGRTIIAGYPWFGDWGRDTFISMRGLCLATGRLDDAQEILGAWAGEVSRGMLPNRFADEGDSPEFNSVDASLWFVVAAGEFLDAAYGWRETSLEPIRDAMLQIVSGYARGTRYGIRADADGLLASGEPGVQLTWMDARVESREVTPRTGKPVEVQALWINALHFASRLDPMWRDSLERARASFTARFWNEQTGCLFEVIDVDHRRGVNDGTIRPNQILAVGGLPLQLIDGERAARIVHTVEQRLLTPLGLRTLAPGEPGYIARYEGGPRERDGAYHQGTVWPWLIGPFVEAWWRVKGKTPEHAVIARDRFLAPLMHHLDEGGIDGVSEIADADPPRLPRGCPFQAWSVGELLRVSTMLDAAERSAH